MEELNIEQGTNLVFSPHFDDAVFSLGGLLGKYPQQTKVITVFAGIPEKPISRNWDRMCGFKDSTEAVTARITENVLALGAFGIENQSIINLPYLDLPYRRSFLKRGVLSNEARNSLSIQIQKIISETTDNDINLFIPMFDIHEDHATVRDTLIEIHQKSKTIKKMNLYLYQDMPYFYGKYERTRILNPFKSKEEILASLSPQLGNYTQKYIGMSEEEFSKKMSAGKLYASQFHSKILGLTLLGKKQRFISMLQAKIFELQTPHGEIVYQIL